MYNKKAVDKLINFIKSNDGIGDKSKLSKMTQKEFGLVLDRSVYYCDDFSIRFSQSKTKHMSNCVLSLSALQKYDNRPFIVCIVTPTNNYMQLANTTFLKKISHSSQQLREDNIKGTFLGNDIMETLGDISNEPQNFSELYFYHEGLTFEDNLSRLVEATNNIVGRDLRFEVTKENKKIIIGSIDRAKAFIKSEDYKILRDDLDSRVKKVCKEIVLAAFIENVNLRGRIIEYLITDNGSTLKDNIIKYLNKEIDAPPVFKTEDKLGDYSREFKLYNTETDIKTKIMWLGSCPKAYNIDKLLEFLSTEKSVYMLYLVGIGEEGKLYKKLCSVFDKNLIDASQIQFHWAGRKSRGVVQFSNKLHDIILSKDATSVGEKADIYLTNLINIQSVN